MKDIRVEKLGKNKAVITINIAAETVEKGIAMAYEHNKGELELEGFEKGAVPRDEYEKVHGDYTFLEAGLNEVLPDILERAVNASGLDIVSTPELTFPVVEMHKDIQFTATVYTKPEVILGQYKGLHVPEEMLVAAVSDQEIQQVLELVRKQNGRKVSVDRRVKIEDEVVFDFQGFVDDVAFEGGTAENFPLVIGSDRFIPGFEIQMLGRKLEEPFDVVVTFPENYPSEEVAGKEAVFKCLIHEIRELELPELDDDFISDITECETLEEYKQELREQLAQEKQGESNVQKESYLVEQVVNSTQVVDMPECMIEKEMDAMVDEFSFQLNQAGMDIESYMQMANMDMDTFRAQIRPDGEKKVIARLALEKIAELELLVVTEAELQQEIQTMITTYGLQDDSLFTPEAKEMLKADLITKKAMKFIVDASC